MAEETSMAQVPLLMQQQMAAQQRILERMAEAPPLAQHASTAAASVPPEARPSAMRIDFKKFSGEPEDWNAWSKVYMAQISALGCEDVLTTPAAQGNGCWSEWRKRRRWPSRPQPLRRQRHQKRGRRQ